jgi:hypothetical protein
VLLTPEVITIVILNAVILFFAAVAFYFSIKILLHYNKEATTPKQYRLEKRSYLVATIIKFIFYVKIPLFAFFIFTLDKISTILPGAMCAAGVVSATQYGTGLLLLKILNLYLFAFWIVLNGEDMKSEEQKYLKMKFLLFAIAFVLLLCEIFIQDLMFYSIDVTSVVDCCGSIYSTTDGTYLSYFLNASPSITLSLFYGIFFLMFLSFIFKNRYLFSLLNLLFIIIALLTLIAFFGTYIYELPTHHCPFCMLQKDYHYIGYLLYLTLFIGTFEGLLTGLIEFDDELQKKYRLSLIFNALYLLLVTYYPLSYYMKNGVFL